MATREAQIFSAQLPQATEYIIWGDKEGTNVGTEHINTKIIASSKEVKIKDLTEIVKVSKKILELFNLLNDEKVEIEKTERAIIVKTAKGKYTFPTAHASEIKNEIEDSKIELSVKAKDIKDMLFLSKICESASYLTYKNVLLIEVEEGKMKSTVSDGFKLVHDEIMIKEEVKEKITGFLDKKTCEKMIAFLNNIKEEEIKIALSGSELMLKSLDRVFVAKLVNVRYPDYDAVNRMITEDYKKQELDLENLKSSLLKGKAEIYSRAKKIYCCIKNEEEEAEYEILIGEGEIDSKIKVLSDSIEFLLQLKRKRNKEKVFMKYHSEKKAVKFVLGDEEQSYYIVQQIKEKGEEND